MNNIITQEEKNRIDALCKEYYIRDYTINSDGTIDVAGHVLITGTKLTQLPLKFNIVHADFRCSDNKLTSLEGCPVEVGGSFNCGDNKLTSLYGCPSEVGGSFYCSFNLLSSLEGCPTIIGGEFDCYRNKITSLLHCPIDVGGKFDFEENPLPNEFIEEYDFLFGIINQIDDDDDDDDEDINTITYEQKIFLKYQHYYDVWEPAFNKENMKGLIDDIKDGLR